MARFIRRPFRYRSLVVAGALTVSFGMVVGAFSRFASASEGPFRLVAQRGRQVSLEGVGVVEAAAPNLVRAQVNNLIFFIQVGPQSIVKVRGQADPDYLGVGTPVACEVSLDEAGKPTAPVAKVYVMPDEPPGVYLDDGNPETPLQPTPRKRPAGTYRVVGPIRTVLPEGGYLVVAGSERFTLEFAPDTTPLVDSRNVALATPGAQVKVTGKYQDPGIVAGQQVPPLQAWAEEIEIDLQEPLPYRGKKRPARK